MRIVKVQACLFKKLDDALVCPSSSYPANVRKGIRAMRNPEQRIRAVTAKARARGP